MRYPGGKNAEGTYQRIINLIPPHRVYVEPFAGSAAIARLKKPAERTILIDRDQDALDSLLGRVPGRNVELVCANGLACLWAACQTESIDAETFIYCDPPYMLSTLKSRPRYRFTLSDREHQDLLVILTWAGAVRHAKILVSGYRSELYDRLLAGWHLREFQVMTRGGRMAGESLWWNYPTPLVCHDTRYVGEDRRERWNLKRMARRLRAKLLALDGPARQRVLAELMEGLTESGRGENLVPTPPAASGFVR